MKELVYTFVVTFILIYVLYLIFVVFRKKKLGKIKSSTEVSFIKKRYNLKLKNVSDKKVALDVAFCNSFIIATTLAIMSLFEKFVLQVLVGFIVLVLLILIIYSILGIEYRRKEDKNV